MAGRGVGTGPRRAHRTSPEDSGWEPQSPRKVQTAARCLGGYQKTGSGSFPRLQWRKCRPSHHFQLHLPPRAGFTMEEGTPPFLRWQSREVQSGVVGHKQLVRVRASAKNLRPRFSRDKGR